MHQSSQIFQFDCEIVEALEQNRVSMHKKVIEASKDAERAGDECPRQKRDAVVDEIGGADDMRQD